MLIQNTTGVLMPDLSEPAVVAVGSDGTRFLNRLISVVLLIQTFSRHIPGYISQSVVLRRNFLLKIYPKTKM